MPDDITEDELKALGAAAASSGAVALLFHAVGITLEATTLDEALQGREPQRIVDVSATDLLNVCKRWNKAKPGDAHVAVSFGTPHFSVDEFRALRCSRDTTVLQSPIST